MRSRSARGPCRLRLELEGTYHHPYRNPGSVSTDSTSPPHRLRGLGSSVYPTVSGTKSSLREKAVFLTSRSQADCFLPDGLRAGCSAETPAGGRSVGVSTWLLFYVFRSLFSDCGGSPTGGSRVKRCRMRGNGCRRRGVIEVVVFWRGWDGFSSQRVQMRC